MKLCNWWFFSFEIILSTLSIFEFLKFKIQILKTTSDGKTINMKVVDLKKLWNFVVDDVFIWNHLVNVKYIWIPQI
jgi:hypothetical protein